VFVALRAGFIAFFSKAISKDRAFLVVILVKN